MVFCKLIRVFVIYIHITENINDQFEIFRHF